MNRKGIKTKNVKVRGKKSLFRKITLWYLTLHAENRYNQAKFLDKLKEDKSYEKNVSTFQSEKKENAWISGSYENSQR